MKKLDYYSEENDIFLNDREKKQYRYRTNMLVKKYNF